MTLCILIFFFNIIKFDKTFAEKIVFLNLKNRAYIVNKDPVFVGTACT